MKAEESRIEPKEPWNCDAASSEDSADPKGSSGTEVFFFFLELS